MNKLFKIMGLLGLCLASEWGTAATPIRLGKYQNGCDIIHILHRVGSGYTAVTDSCEPRKPVGIIYKLVRNKELERETGAPSFIAVRNHESSRGDVIDIGGGTLTFRLNKVFGSFMEYTPANDGTRDNRSKQIFLNETSFIID